jgi:hypothetical protein
MSLFYITIIKILWLYKLDIICQLSLYEVFTRFVKSCKTAERLYHISFEL